MDILRRIEISCVLILSHIEDVHFLMIVLLFLLVTKLSFGLTTSDNKSGKFILWLWQNGTFDTVRQKLKICCSLFTIFLPRLLVGLLLSS